VAEIGVIVSLMAVPFLEAMPVFLPLGPVRAALPRVYVSALRKVDKLCYVNLKTNIHALAS
jgi:hypothetical protein